MANYWAIAIGVNQYQHFQPLMYAQRDAQVFRDTLIKNADFPAQQCFLLTDSGAGMNRTETLPQRNSIQACIAHTCRQRLHPGDVLWCFFSGYGVCVDGKDYLMPIDGDPNSVETSGISMEWLLSTLSLAKTDNVVLLLDVNRSQGMAGAGMGNQTAQLAREHRVPVILSCRSDQFSHETLALRQGLFTTALLEGLRYEQCRTLEQIAQYLDDRLPQLSEHHWRPPQNPVAILPVQKKHQLMLPEPLPVAAGQMNPPVEREETFAETPDRFIPVYGYPRADRRSVAEADPLPSMPSFSADRTTQFDDFPSDSLLAPDRPEPGESLPSPQRSPDWNRLSSFADPFPEETVQTPSIEPIPPEEQPEISDRLFWRRLLTWGGIIAAVLLIGVIIRNANQSDPAANTALLLNPARQDAGSTESEAPSAAPSQPAIQAEPGSPLETAYIATRSRRFQDAKQYLEQVPRLQRRGDYQKVLDETNKGLLSDAKVTLTQTRELTDENQASDFVAALEMARLIQPGEPHYDEAQEYVDRWSRVIFDMAQGRADRRNDSSSTVAADNYRTAIRTVRLIPPDAPVYNQGQAAIAQWSQRLFELANDRAIEGKYDVAVYVAELIPSDAPVYPEAQEAIEAWRDLPSLYVAPTP
ncbi:caspase family protein [Egbenema bharatensis]|uniref:caspase family protein n=1 Tax=Egbenema bharatensis TaxID=3463334 RepID=UPI003A8A2009